MNEVTRILSAIEQGDPHAAERFLPVVYDELRRLAAAHLAQEKPGQTLDATALVHEAYLRLVGDQHFENRRHFFAAAAEAMRRILVENARRKQRDKHGGRMVRRAVDEIDVAAPEEPEDLLALEEALAKLTRTDATAAELVGLRFFAGMTIPQAAELMNLSVRTADRLWAYARGLSPCRDLFQPMNEDLACWPPLRRMWRIERLPRESKAFVFPEASHERTVPFHRGP